MRRMDQHQLEAEREERANHSRRVPEQRISLTVPSRRSFFSGIESRLRRQLPAEFGQFHTRSYFHLLKVSYDNERVHYEIGLDVHRGAMEIALHFEDGSVTTAEWLAYFDRRIIEVKERLGWQIELERWTLSWGRLYEMIPLTQLDRTVTDQTADRLVTWITTLQPMVESAAILPDARRISAPRRPPRRRR